MPAHPSALPSNLESVPLARPGYPAAILDRTLSIIIPLANEEGNILPLATELDHELQTDARVRDSYEILFIDDASTDASREEVMRAATRYPHIRLICHANRFGKGQAVRNGLRNARGAWVITMDGDGQNDPADMKRLMDIAWEKGTDTNILVSGVRVARADTRAKRWASRMANAIRRTLLKDDSPDTGCALKMFRRDAYLALPYFDNMHRYEPVLFQLYAIPVAYVPVNDRVRQHGTSKYTNWKRALEGLRDLAGVMWLQARHRGRASVAHEIRPVSQKKDMAAE